MHAAPDTAPSLRSAARTLAALLTALWLLLLAWWLLPWLSPGRALHELRASPEYRRHLEEVLRVPLPAGEEAVHAYPVSPSPLVGGMVAVRVVGESDGKGRVAGEALSRELRTERLLLLGALWAVLCGILLRLPALLAGLAPGAAPPPATAEGMLAYEAALARREAERVATRSGLLLVAGIGMAFLGVVVFSFTVPAYRGAQAPAAYLAQALRPAMVLLFLEGIAWFLLHQHRAVGEDYKSFHRLYLRRSNLLAAFRLLQGEAPRREDLFLAVALVEEDLSGRLRAGETTEGLEAQKLSGPNPVFSVVESLLRQPGPGRG